MKGYQVNRPTGVDGVDCVEMPDPRVQAGEVLVRVRACSLNYRDLGVLRGGYYRNDKQPVVPISDMAGVVEAVGSGVASLKEGDRVTANLVRDWLAGPPTDAVLRTGFGGGIDGFLRERVAVPEHCLLKIPDSLSFEQAATLPCAAVTVWHALLRATQGAGQTLLLLGTGGVSMFGLQLGKALGYRCIITSSSDTKLEKAKTLGADEVINYRTQPEWPRAVRECTAGLGVDHVLEVGGAGTLAASIACTKVGGTISLIGLLARTGDSPAMMPMALDCMNLHGVYVGSRAMYGELLDFVSRNSIEPVIDRVFDFDQAKQAYAHLAGQLHIGKVVICLP